jgi:hypothetical protein
MTRGIIDEDVNVLLEGLFSYQTLYSSAVRRQDIPTANEHILKVSAYADALAAKGLDGRKALEQLLTNPSTYG